MITLRFVEGGGWDSKVIRWDTRCRWSHVEILKSFDNDHISPFTIGAMLDGGVKARELNDRNYAKAVAYQTWGIHCSAEQEEVFNQFINSQIGKPYDWRAIASFGLGQRDWRENDSWFCSELVARGLELVGLLELPSDQPVWRITPRDVWILVASWRQDPFKKTLAQLDKSVRAVLLETKHVGDDDGRALSTRPAGS